MKRRALLRAGMMLAAAPAVAGEVTAQGEKVLRYAFNNAETGFDPAQISDLYSRNVAAAIFDPLYRFDYLARPVKIKPNTAAALPQSSSDLKAFTVRIRPGIYFADDPAFRGKPRELVAADYVYQFKRIADPRSKSPAWPSLEEQGLLGLAALREEARKTGRFDYDREIAGLRAVDRYTIEFRSSEPQPRFVQGLTDVQVGAVAREVVELYGDDIMAHPVGSGPFQLAEWRRSSRIVLTRNPRFRDEFYDEEAPAGDRKSQEIAARLKGRRMPMIDRVEISIIDEPQPRWLAFLNGEHDMIERLPATYAPQAAPNNRLAPFLQKRGVVLERNLLSDLTYFVYNMEHPVIGGYTPEKVALRRAIGLGTNIEDEIRLPRKGQAIRAQSPIPPFTFGYDPELVTANGIFDPARAAALLDTFGYVDRDGDGFREMPDGSPLVLEQATQPEGGQVELDEVLKRDMTALGIRWELKYGKWAEQLRQARAGDFMIWSLGGTAASYDSEDYIRMGYGPNKGFGNFSRFDLPAYNALYERQRLLPDGPERIAIFREAIRVLVAYAPMKFHVHRIGIDLHYPWVYGYRRHPFMREFFRYIDIDPAYARDLA